MALKIRRGKVRPPAKDRKISLMLIGILDILGGLLLALMVPFMIFAYRVGQTAAVPPAHPLKLGATVGICALYLGWATLAIWAGVGLCLCRRWARSLVLAASWGWLVSGILVTVMMVFIMPDIFEKLAVKPGMSSGSFLTLMKWFMSIFMFTIGILVPGIKILVLRHPNVRDTCHYRDPKTRWTDRVPLPILILILWDIFWAFSMLFILARPVAPFFGLVLTGLPAMAVALGGTAALAWVVREIYFLRIRGWWGSLAIRVCWGLSYIITLSRHGLLEMSGSANMSPEEVATLSQSPIYQGNWFAFAMTAIFLIYIGYVIFCKRYFLKAKRAGKKRG